MTNRRDLSAKNAAVAFTQITPQYEICAENSALMLTEIQRLVEEKGADACSVATYQQAFSTLNAEGKLKLQELPRSEPEPDLEHMSAAEYKRRVVVPEWQSRQKKAEPPSEKHKTLQTLFESHGLALSSYNLKLVTGFMNARGLEYSVSNLETAIEHLNLEVSDAVVERLPADIYRKVVVEPEFRERESKQPKPEPSNVPLGVRSYSSWLHNQ
jgi:hypothetical protein